MGCQRIMAHQHAFGPACRTRSKNHIGRAVWFDVRFDFCFGQSLEILLIQRQDFGFTGQFTDIGGFGNDQRRISVFDHPGQTIFRIIQSQWRVSAAGLKNGQKRDRQVHITLETYAHQTILYFVVTQKMGPGGLPFSSARRRSGSLHPWPMRFYRGVCPMFGQYAGVPVRRRIHL